MRKVLRCAAVALLCGALASARTASAELVLVEKGVSLAPIVVFEGAPPMTRQAAAELAEYIEKTSGARPELIVGEPDPVPERAIWVGYQPILKTLLPEVDFEFAYPEEIVIAASERHLAIAGLDRWNPDHMVAEGRRGPVEGVQQAYGTANAVYTFLQDYLGVRWLWPGELGEDIAPSDTIAFEPFEFRYLPQMRLRSGLFRFSAPGDNRGRSHDWTKFQRLHLDASGSGHELNDVIGGHAFGDWWERFHETRPDYFALQPDGTRSGFPAPRNAKLCQSNPAVWEQWLADVERQLQKTPNRFIFNASPNDSHNRGICVCRDCLALDHPEGEAWRFSWQGVAQEHVAMSDRYVTFANRLARRLKARYPDKDYYVLMFAYGPSLAAPIEARPDDNVIIATVHSFLLEYDMERRPQFADWGRVAPNLMWRPNTPLPTGWSSGYPAALFDQVMKSLRFVGENGCQGIYVDTVWEASWATQGPLYYLMAQLAWNPRADGQAVMAEYFARGFGPGAEAMGAYWALQEEKSEFVLKNYPRRWIDTLSNDLGEVYDEAFFERAGALLDQAAQAVADGPEAYPARVDFMRAGLEFTRLAVDQRRRLARIEETDGADADAAAQAEENWEAMKRLGEAHPHLFRTGQPSNVFRPRR